MLTDLQTLAKALGGEVNRSQVLAPGPGHSAIDRSLSVKLDSNAPDGFLVHSFAGDDPSYAVTMSARKPDWNPSSQTAAAVSAHQMTRSSAH